VRNIRVNVDDAGFQAMMQTMQEAPMVGDMETDEENRDWIAQGSPTIKEWGSGFSPLIEVNPNREHSDP